MSTRPEAGTVGGRLRRLRWLRPAALAVLAAVCAGCMVPLRGRDFGSWFSFPEPVPLVRVRTPGPASLSGGERLLVLPLLGEAGKAPLKALRAILAEEARKYFPCRVVPVSADGPLAAYVAPENLLEIDGRFNIQEIAGLGRYLDATHVLAVDVRGARFYPPQNLEIGLVVIEAASGLPVAELDAGFSAEEQGVLVALGRHLDLRRARPYDRDGLESVLRSPTEYGRFALAECCRVLAEDLWTAAGLRNGAETPTTIVRDGQP